MFHIYIVVCKWSRFWYEGIHRGSWDAFWKPEIKLQRKTATVDGYVGNAGLPTRNAEYVKRKSWCPYSSDPDGREYILHLN